MNKVLILSVASFLSFSAVGQESVVVTKKNKDVQKNINMAGVHLEKSAKQRGWSWVCAAASMFSFYKAATVADDKRNLFVITGAGLGVVSLSLNISSNSNMGKAGRKLKGIKFE